MKNAGTIYFGTAAIFALIGMAWGIQMSASGDHSLAPAHGHLNLIGFVTIAIFGTFYTLSPAAAASKLCLVHYILTVVAVVMMAPGIAMAIMGTGETLAKVSSIIGIVAMGLFVFNVFRFGIPPREA